MSERPHAESWESEAPASLDPAYQAELLAMVRYRQAPLFHEDEEGLRATYELTETKTVPEPTSPIRDSDVERMIQLVCGHFKVTREEVLAPQTPRFRDPRVVCMALLKSELGLSNRETGEYLDRTDVNISVTTTNNRERLATTLQSDIERIRAAYRNGTDLDSTPTIAAEMEQAFNDRESEVTAPPVSTEPHPAKLETPEVAAEDQQRIINQVCGIVAEQYATTRERMVKKVNPSATQARKTAAFLLVEELGLDPEFVGAALGRDSRQITNLVANFGHQLARNGPDQAFEQVKGRVEQDPRLAEMLDRQPGATSRESHESESADAPALEQLRESGLSRVEEIAGIVTRYFGTSVEEVRDLSTPDLRDARQTIIYLTATRGGVPIELAADWWSRPSRDVSTMLMRTRQKLGQDPRFRRQMNELAGKLPDYAELPALPQAETVAIEESAGESATVSPAVERPDETDFLRTVFEAVATYHGLEHDEVVNASQTRRSVLARNLALHLARTDFGVSRAAAAEYIRTEPKEISTRLYAFKRRFLERPEILESITRLEDHLLHGRELIVPEPPRSVSSHKRPEPEPERWSAEEAAAEIERIVTVVMDYYGISETELRQMKSRRYSQMRRAVNVLAADHAEISHRQLAEWWGSSESAVKQMLQSTHLQLTADPEFGERVDDLAAYLFTYRPLQKTPAYSAAQAAAAAEAAREQEAQAAAEQAAERAADTARLERAVDQRSTEQTDLVKEMYAAVARFYHVGAGELMEVSKRNSPRVSRGKNVIAHLLRDRKIESRLVASVTGRTTIQVTRMKANASRSIDESLRNDIARIEAHLDHGEPLGESDLDETIKPLPGLKQMKPAEEVGETEPDDGNVPLTEGQEVEVSGILDQSMIRRANQRQKSRTSSGRKVRPQRSVDQEEKAFFKAISRGDRTALTEFESRYGSLPGDIIANRFPERSPSELEPIAVAALLKAGRNFSPEAHADFPEWAEKVIVRDIEAESERRAMVERAAQVDLGEYVEISFQHAETARRRRKGRQPLAAQNCSRAANRVANEHVSRLLKAGQRISAGQRTEFIRRAELVGGMPWLLDKARQNDPTIPELLPFDQLDPEQQQTVIAAIFKVMQDKADIAA